MCDKGNLQLAIERAIRPYTKEENDPFFEGELTNSGDHFVSELAAFLTRELVDSNVSIRDDQAELDDEELERLPITQILVPHIKQLISPDDPVSIVANIIRIYTAPAPDPETHLHVRYGSCEVLLHLPPPSLQIIARFQGCVLRRCSYVNDRCR